MDIECAGAQQLAAAVIPSNQKFNSAPVLLSMIILTDVANIFL
jgi:hypothetical protein